MHLQGGDMNQETWPDEFVMHLMIAQHVANVLTKKTFDAFPKFLHAIDVLLLHSPCAIRRVGRSRIERFNLFLHPKIPRNIRHQILNDWERDRKSTRLNSSHVEISYAVFCLKKKKQKQQITRKNLVTTQAISILQSI